MMNSTMQIEGKEYRITGSIGEGAAATVYLAINSKGEDFALKLIKNYKNPIVKEMVDTEINIQKKFKNSKYVIQYVGFERTKDLVFIVLELGECSLRNWIESKSAIWQAQYINLICYVCKGLMEVHQNKIIHRDIKPENIIKIKNMYKITDFGVSCQNEEDQNVSGTPLYWAPEIIFQLKDKFTNKVDVWSFGVTIFQVYFKVNPFCPKKDLPYRQSMQELKRNIKQLTPNFNMKKLTQLLVRLKMFEEAEYIQNKIKNTSKSLVENLCLFFEPDPQKRPQIQIFYALFESQRDSIQMPQLHKSKINQKICKFEQLPDDIRLFVTAKDMFYQLNTYFQTKLYEKVVFGLQLAIWYLQGSNYGGTHYVFLDKISQIKQYRKPAVQLWNEVKILLSEYYFYLKTEQETKNYEQVDELRMRILICSVWSSIMKEDKNFCKLIFQITNIQIGHPLKLIAYLQLFSHKNIQEIQQKIVLRYYI